MMRRIIGAWALSALLSGAAALRAAPRMSTTPASAPAVSSAAEGGGGTGIPGVKSIIAVSSCKGGVGKSTTAVNLAYALRDAGSRVGILDTDVFGPSLPTMVTPDAGSSGKVEIEDDMMMMPLESEGVKLMSMGYLRDGVAIMRGPMVMQLVQQLVSKTQWGELDYLVVDLPPGTGDVQLTITQALQITAAVIVTTPQRLSFVDVVKGIDMFDTVGVPCVAVVENMAYYEVPDLSATEKGLTKAILKAAASAGDAAGAAEAAAAAARKVLLERPVLKRQRLFGDGHKQRLAEMWGIENTVSLPVTDEIARSGDTGRPYVLSHPESAHAAAFRTLAAGVVADVEEMRASGGGLPAVDYVAEENVIKVGDDFEIDPIALRAKCRCAQCVEELTGRPLLDPATIASDTRPAVISGVGRYAFCVDWNDGHKSLYPYKWILEADDTAAEAR